MKSCAASASGSLPRRCWATSLAKLVLGYVLGKIPEPVNPDTVDQDECKQYLENPTCGDVQEVVDRRRRRWCR